MPKPSVEAKKDLLRKYALGLSEIWQRLIDEGPEVGDPIALFDEAVAQTEKALAGLMARP
jgi:hypothetical protein